MEQPPLISIVIPTWNHGRELMVCLKSVEEQSYRPIEVVVVDDASTDDTARRLKEYRASFPLKIMSMPKRSGAPAARNFGARNVNGGLIIFLDADVVLKSDAIERMAQTLERHPEAAFAYPSFRFGWKRFASRAFDAKALRRGPYIHTTALMRRSVFPGFDEKLEKFQDWDLWLTIADRGGKGIWIPEELFTVHVRKEGMSRWMPSFVHRIHWPLFGWMPKEIARYRKWESVVRRKHGIED
jgi:glycosyltransferase involved in cell wall biosynthesis